MIDLRPFTGRTSDPILTPGQNGYMVLSMQPLEVT